MICGMTGFGSSQALTENVKIVVEIKSLNHRYLDINYYLPPGFTSTENKIRQIIERALERGRVTVSVRVVQKTTQNISINKDVVKSYLKQAQLLEKTTGLKNNLHMSDLIRLPGVVETKDVHLEPEDLWPIIEKNVQKALAGLIYMRKREGQSLAKDVTDKLKSMTLQTKQIQKRSDVILKSKKNEFSPEEFKSFQKSCDVNEELSRLDHYIDELKLLIKSNVSVGKKFDFIAQEMQRETNTIGSKLLDKMVSNAVITLKSKIEKIREQSQNIE